MLEQLKEQVYQANMLLPAHHLVTFTWGNVSGIDRESGIMAIKPSGVEYDQLSPEDMVLVDIRSKSMWAQFGRAEIREKLLAQKESAGRERTKTLQAELSAIDRRLPELDRLVQSAYEDKVLGKIPENLCVQLLNGYEAERKAKQERRRELTEQLAASRENEQSVDAWLDMVQDYYNLEELDRPTLVRLIQKIEVGEKRMVNGHEERDFNIYYNFIGHIDL